VEIYFRRCWYFFFLFFSSNPFLPLEVGNGQTALGISGTFDYQLCKEYLIVDMNQCAVHDVCTGERENYSRKLLLFTLLITAALRSRLRSKCYFLAAFCPRWSKMILRIKRKWKMICTSDGSNMVSFLSICLSPPFELPVESHMLMGGGISALTTDHNSSSCSEEDCCRAGVSKFDIVGFFFLQDKDLGVTL